MPRMSKVELYAAIRRDHRDGMSMRELERKHGVTWRTVRKALDSSWPEPRKRLPPRATTLDPYKAVIDEILRADLDAPRKQRHTVTRIFHRLVEEHGADVSYGVVRYYVAGRKPVPVSERDLQCGGVCREAGVVAWMYLRERNGRREAVHERSEDQARHQAVLSDEHKAYQELSRRPTGIARTARCLHR
ncbi:hypothetical protein [Streptomyces sp. NBC_01497]|uniref:hypothetical protein n=1 Tax=Streptomyces sp. NBC_01497 TaxID=2903885 RepID=UPI002E3805A3|nr:hypothetical protein [Streptomyces sp. NBC_01497]